MPNSTGIAVLESKWWRKSNVSIRGLFELISDISTENPHAYHYEMANSEAAIKEAIPRIASYRDCRYLCLAMHGNHDGLYLLNNERLTRSELRNALVTIKSKSGSRLEGIYLASCIFGTQEIADFMFQKDIGLKWIAGYSTEIDWIVASALDLLFFNELANCSESTETKVIRYVAERLQAVAPGLIEELGFGIYVRKQKTGGAKNLLAEV